MYDDLKTDSVPDRILDLLSAYGPSDLLKLGERDDQPV
jgi:hypothetical protein